MTTDSVVNDTSQVSPVYYVLAASFLFWSLLYSILSSQGIITQGSSCIGAVVSSAKSTTVTPFYRLENLGEGKVDNLTKIAEIVKRRKGLEHMSLTSFSVCFNFLILLLKLHGAWHIFTWQMLMWKETHIDMPLTTLGSLMLGLIPSECWWLSST